MPNRRIIKRLFEIVVCLLILTVTSKLVIPALAAGRFSTTTFRLDRMKELTNTSAYLMIVPSSAGTEDRVVINLGAGWSIAAVPTVNTTGLPAGISALPGTLTAAGAGTSIVITGVSDLSVGTSYGVNIATGISTPAAGVYYPVIDTRSDATTVIDEVTVASRFITNDQIVITANVPPTFTFTLSGTTDTFTADLSPSAVVSTNGRTVSVSTNAAKGWTGWVKSANAALTSATAGESIGTTGSVDDAPDTCAIGTDCYVLDADKTTTGTGSGSLDIAGEYNGTDTSSGGTLSTTLTPFVTRTGKTNGDVITLIARASIVATKAAGADYTDTLTVIGAGNF